MGARAPFTSLYKELLRPLFFLADPEAVHHGAIAAMGVAGLVLAKPDPRPARTVFGVTFPNPVQDIDDSVKIMGNFRMRENSHPGRVAKKFRWRMPQRYETTSCIRNCR